MNSSRIGTLFTFVAYGSHQAGDGYGTLGRRLSGIGFMIGGSELAGAGTEGMMALSELSAAEAAGVGTGVLVGATLATGGLVLVGVALVGVGAWLW
jgi:hypothetical protein